MNAEEIRAEVVERLAIAVRASDLEQHPALSNGNPRDLWNVLNDGMRDQYRAYVTPLVEALGDLLPTGEEVSTCFPDEPAADDEAMRRYVTDWQEVPR